MKKRRPWEHAAIAWILRETDHPDDIMEKVRYWDSHESELRAFLTIIYGFDASADSKDGLRVSILNQVNIAP